MRRISIILCVLCIIFGQAVMADESVQDSQKIDTMVVTASRVPENIMDVTSNVTVITEEEIKQSSATDLGELLGENGFLIQGYENTMVQLDIRGFKTEFYDDSELESYVLILVDGRRAGTGLVNKINIDNVERVEIIRGPGSVQYGASAMGGVINVITKKGKGKPSFNVEKTYGSWDYNKTTGSAQGSIKNFDFSVNASKESKGDYATAEGDTYYNTGFDSKTRISANAGWSFMPGNRIGVTYTEFRSEKSGQMQPIKDSTPDDSGNVRKSYNDKIDIVYEGKKADDFLQWTVRYFKGENQYRKSEGKDEQQGGQAQLTGNWHFARVTAGFDWINYEKSTEYDNPAAFLMTKFNFLDNKLILSAGARQDWYEMKSGDGRSVDDSNWTPSLGLAYKFTPNFKVRAKYSEGFKVPAPVQLFRDEDYGFAVLIGNPDLTPEKGKTHEFGLDYDNGPITGSLTYQHTDFEDKIEYYYEPGSSSPQVWTYINVTNATISSLEGMLKIDYGTLFTRTFIIEPYISLARLFEYKNDETNEELYYNPEWKFSYGIRFAKPDAGFESKLNFVHLSRWLTNDYQGTGQTHMPGYRIADLTLSKELASFDKYGKIALKADCRNLFNKYYENMQGYPLPGRTFFLSMKYEY